MSVKGKLIILVIVSTLIRLTLGGNIQLGNDEVYYYIGCESMKNSEVVKANIAILKKAGVKFSTNLEKVPFK